MVWKGLSSREKAKILAERTDEGRRSAFSTDGFGTVAHEDAQPQDSDTAQEKFTCEDFVEEWFQEVGERSRTSDSVSSGGYPTVESEKSYPQRASSGG